MPHLLKAEPKGIFEATTPERQRPVTDEAGTTMTAIGTSMPSPFAVAVDMTPEQQQETLRRRYGNDAMSVENLPPRTRGHHY